VAWVIDQTCPVLQYVLLLAMNLMNVQRVTEKGPRVWLRYFQ
jgi:hypothetical protein